MSPGIHYTQFVGGLLSIYGDSYNENLLATIKVTSADSTNTRFTLAVMPEPGNTATFTDDGIGVTGGKATARYLPGGIEAEGVKLEFPEIGGVIATKDYARGEANRVEEGLQDKLYLTNQKLDGKLDAALPLGAVKDVGGNADVELRASPDWKPVHRFRTAAPGITVSIAVEKPPLGSGKPPVFDGTAERAWEVRIEFTNKVDALSAAWPQNVVWVGHGTPEITVYGEYRFRMWSSDGATIYATQVYPVLWATKGDIPPVPPPFVGVEEMRNVTSLDAPDVYTYPVTGGGLRPLVYGTHNANTGAILLRWVYGTSRRKRLRRAGRPSRPNSPSSKPRSWIISARAARRSMSASLPERPEEARTQTSSRRPCASRAACRTPKSISRQNIWKRRRRRIRGLSA